MNNEPLDMSPGDMALELAEHEYHNATMVEILEIARAEIDDLWLYRAAQNPKSVEEAYFNMIGRGDR